MCAAPCGAAFYFATEFLPMARGRRLPPASPISHCEHLHSSHALARILVVALRYGLVPPFQLQMRGLRAASPGRKMEARASLAGPGIRVHCRKPCPGYPLDRGVDQSQTRRAAGASSAPFPTVMPSCGSAAPALPAPDPCAGSAGPCPLQPEFLAFSWPSLRQRRL